MAIEIRSEWQLVIYTHDRSKYWTPQVVNECWEVNPRDRGMIAVMLHAWDMEPLNRGDGRPSISMLPAFQTLSNLRNHAQADDLTTAVNLFPPEPTARCKRRLQATASEEVGLLATSPLWVSVTLPGIVATVSMRRPTTPSEKLRIRLDDVAACVQLLLHETPERCIVLPKGKASYGSGVWRIRGETREMNKDDQGIHERAVQKAKGRHQVVPKDESDKEVSSEEAPPADDDAVDGDDGSSDDNYVGVDELANDDDDVDE